MVKLLPDRLEVARNLSWDKLKPKRHVVTTILEWIQCFSRYIAVIAWKQSQCIPDLLAYKILIIGSQMEYQGEAWMGYDCWFRQSFATYLYFLWSAIHTTLWNLVFARKAKTTRCSHSFSLTHKSNQCEWDSDQLPSANYHQASNFQPICKAWNTD